MVGAARQLAPHFSAHGSPSARLLAQLQEAHQQLMREMDHMDRVTCGPLPDPAQLTAARWQICQASLSRRTLSAKVSDYLVGRVDDQAAGRLKGLRSDDQLTRSRSARHIYDWTTRSIRLDWDGYCRASREIRMLMKANILLEKQILYPMLERLSAQGI